MTLNIAQNYTNYPLTADDLILPQTSTRTAAATTNFGRTVDPTRTLNPDGSYDIADVINVGVITTGVKWKAFTIPSVPVGVWKFRTTIPEVSIAIGTSINSGILSGTLLQAGRGLRAAASPTVEIAFKIDPAQAAALGGASFFLAQITSASGVDQLFVREGINLGTKHIEMYNKLGLWSAGFGALAATPGLNSIIDKGLVGISFSSRGYQGVGPEARETVEAGLKKGLSPQDIAKEVLNKHGSMGLKAKVGVDIPILGKAAIKIPRTKASKLEGFKVGVSFAYDVDKNTTAMEFSLKGKVKITRGDVEFSLGFSGAHVPAGGSGGIRVGGTLIDAGPGAGGFINKMGKFINGPVDRSKMKSPFDPAVAEKEGYEVKKLGEYFGERFDDVMNVAKFVGIANSDGTLIASADLNVIADESIPDLSHMISDWDRFSKREKLETILQINKAMDDASAGLDDMTEEEFAEGAGLDISKLNSGVDELDANTAINPNTVDYELPVIDPASVQARTLTINAQRDKITATVRATYDPVRQAILSSNMSREEKQAALTKLYDVQSKAVIDQVTALGANMVDPVTGVSMPITHQDRLRIIDGAAYQSAVRNADTAGVLNRYDIARSDAALNATPTERDNALEAVDRQFAAELASVGLKPVTAQNALPTTDDTFQQTLRDLGVTIPDLSMENPAFRAAVTKGFTNGRIDLTKMTAEEQALFKAEYKRIFDETKDLTKAQSGASTMVMTVRIQQFQAEAALKFQRDLTSALVFAGDNVYAALAGIDPKVAAIVEKGFKGAAFVQELLNLTNGVAGADRNAIIAGLKFLATGVFGADVAKGASAIYGVVNLGDALKNFRPGGDQISGTLGAFSAVASIFGSGIFGPELQKIGRQVGLGVSGATLAYNFIKTPNAVNGLAIASFILGQVWKTPEGQAVTSAVGLASAFFSSAMLGPVMGPIGVAFAAIALVASIVKLITGTTLKITDTVDSSADGVNDSITYKTKMDDWFYNITNGGQSLPFTGVGYKLMPDMGPSNSSLLVRGTGRSGFGQQGSATSYVDFKNADGSTRRVNVEVTSNENIFQVSTVIDGDVVILKTFEDDTGKIWVRDPAAVWNATNAPEIKGYLIEINARFKAINDAPSLEGASTSVTKSISKAQYDQLMLQLGGPNGTLVGEDARGELLRPFLAGDIKYKQEKKNEGYTYYADFNGDGNIDRVTKYMKIKNETDGDDSMRYQLLGRDGRIIQEWATDKNGNPAPDSVAARSISGGEFFTDLTGNVVWGRFNVENYILMELGVDANRPVNLEQGGLGFYLGNESSLGDTLVSGQGLTTNQRLISADGSTVLILHDDGNLVMYERFADTGEVTKVLWNSGTSGSGATSLMVQADGNMVLMAGAKSVWSSKTGGKGAARLILQNDANLVLIRTSDNRGLWDAGTIDRLARDLYTLYLLGYGEAQPVQTSDIARQSTQPVSSTQVFTTPVVTTPAVPTIQAPPAGITVLGVTTSSGYLTTNQALMSANGRWLTVFQSDGNLVTYDMLGGMKATWVSNTAGQAAGGFVAVQKDGNMVIYDASAVYKWQSATSGGPTVNRPFDLIIQDDGNLVVYDRQGGEALWSVMTGRLAIPESNPEFLPVTQPVQYDSDSWK